MITTANVQNHLKEPIISCSFCQLFFWALLCLLTLFGSIKEESDSSNK
jgi:hypothetical protein